MNSLTRYRWNVTPQMPKEAMSELSGFHRIMMKLLYNRGLRTQQEAERFIRQVGSLYDPFEMGGMREAVSRIHQAVEDGTPIAVYGDYDADGITASCILLNLLEAIGCKKYCSYIPDRFDEGYGLNSEALQLLYDQGYRLVVTVDCGIRSTEEAAYARGIGLDLIISDHHEPGEEIPAADVVICPKLPGDPYPEKNLAGVGIAYKIAEAMLREYPQKGVEAEDWIDLAAVGTVADIVPLRGENRSIVKAGLRKLRTVPRPGIQALAKAASFNIADINAMTIGFSIAPRINAAGRLDKAEHALNLLMSRNLREAEAHAATLNELNRKRQEMTGKIQDIAAAPVDPKALPDVILSRGDVADFNVGVVGLAAAKVTERFYRPSVVGGIEGETTRCSCRSIPEFNMIEALDECKDLLVKYGGHFMAAGLTVKNENWDALNERLNAIAKKQFAGKDLIPFKDAEMELPLRFVRPDLLEMIDLLEPFGQDNPHPQFMIPGLTVRSAFAMGKDKTHLKLRLCDERGNEIEAVGWGMADRKDLLPDRIDVLCTLERNSWNGTESIQLRLIDLRKAA